MKKIGFPFVRILALFFVVNTFAAVTGLDKDLSEIYQTGKVRFVPEIKLTDESMAGKGFFAQIFDIALDEQGNLFVCDYREGNIKKFDASGTFLETIGRSGQGPGEFGSPIETEWSRGRLYVRELTNMRVSILDGDGHFLKSVPVDMNAGNWWKMRALPDGRFLVQKEKVDYKDLNAPQEVRIDLCSSDLEFVKTIYRHEVRRNKYITEPRRTNVPIPFASSVLWDVLPSGKVLIGYSGQYEFEIHDPDKGKTSSFSHTFSPVEVTAKDKDFYFQGMVTTVGGSGGVVSQKSGAPDYIIKNTEFPKYKPAYHNINIDAEGNIWVQTFPQNARKAEVRMDVFDSAGRFLSNVLVVDGFIPSKISPLRGGFWTSVATEEGGWTIIKYRITE
jgi:hypothetical protein